MTAEVIEGVATEVDEPRSLVIPDQGMAATGALALAALSDDEFTRRLDALTKGRERIERIQKALMTKDVDYGLIPGTPKPTLYKPGAEMLGQMYALAADFIPKRTVGDGITEPALSYLTRCELHLGSFDGPVIATGYGAANSWERKHRYRNADRVCPNCGQPAIIKGKDEYGGGWVCFKKKGGCGSKWPDGATEIEAQTVGQVDNPDPFDLDVVLAKMAEKRAHVDATLRATNASRLFTQDVEDLARPEPAPTKAPTVERFDGGLIGMASLGSMAPVTGELCESPDGSDSLGFVIGEGRERVQVVAKTPLAEALAPVIGDFIGQRVQVFGPVTSESMTVKGRDVPFSRLHLERITTPDWTLPAFEEATEAETMGAFPEEDLSELEF